MEPATKKRPLFQRICFSILLFFYVLLVPFIIRPVGIVFFELISLVSEVGRRRWRKRFRRLFCLESSNNTEVGADDGSSIEIIVVRPESLTDVGSEMDIEDKVVDLDEISAKPFEEKRKWFTKHLQSLNPNAAFFTFHIARSISVFEQSFRLISNIPNEELKKSLRIVFVGETGIDYGGLLREWYQVLCTQIFDLELGLFQFAEMDMKAYQINPISAVHEDHLAYFHFVGVIIGKALLEQIPIPAYLVPSLYKQFLDHPCDLSDVETVDISTYRSLSYILENDVDNLCLGNFAVTTEALGVRREIELVEGGKDIEISEENKAEFVALYTQWICSERTKEAIEHLKMGLFAVIPPSLLSVFSWKELQLLTCGLPSIDVDDWKANTQYSGKYSENHKVIKWFWETVTAFSDIERASLLQFVTGSSIIPAQGFSGLEGYGNTHRPFRIVSVAVRESYYPRAHTCFNTLDLPEYKSRGVMEERMRKSLELAGVGFGLA